MSQLEAGQAFTRLLGGSSSSKHRREYYRAPQMNQVFRHDKLHSAESRFAGASYQKLHVTANSTWFSLSRKLTVGADWRFRGRD